MEHNPVRPERRQLTILFSDMVGSSALSQRLDLEDLRDLIRLYQKTCTTQVCRFGGTVSKYLGDGILALFGYPNAHEDDAERAINAGLAIVNAFNALGSKSFDGGEHSRLAVRVGIATGLVIAGDLIGEGVSEEAAVVGETPNLAARIQQLAKTNMVVVHDSTKELAGTGFDYYDLGLQPLSGFAEPVRVWQVLRRQPVRSRFEAAHPANLTPLVGREINLVGLLEHWQLATLGMGQAVLLTGEAGIGKSRIAQTLDERLETEEHELIRFQCSSYHVESTLHPFIEQLEWAAGLATSDTPSSKIDKLEHFVEISDLGVSAVPLLAALLSIPDDGRFPLEAISAQQRKERTLGVLIDRLRNLSARKPLLAIIEDAHWADPTSLELMQRILDVVSLERMLVIVTFRPEFKPPWIPAAHISEMVLERLTAQQATELAAAVVAPGSLPVSVSQQIVAKTDGVPLFIEEVTRAVHAYQSQKDLAESGKRLTVPATIRDTLTARMDQLGTAKQFAQIGATIGRSFSYLLLAAAADVSIDSLRNGLNQLVGSGLLYQEGSPPEATYSFKHALVQDTAYESLLRSERRKLHGRIAELLIDRFPEVSKNQPEVVAHHFFQAGYFAESANYWLSAGKIAIERSANIEAVAHLRNALGAIERVSDQQEVVHLELPVQLSLGVALTATEGFASPSVEAAYARARVLSEAATEGPELFYALCGLGSFYTVRANLGAALEVAQRLLELGHMTQSPDLLVWGYIAVGVTQLNLGELGAARANLGKGISIYDPSRHGHHAFVCGQDAGIIGRCHLAWLKWLMGDPDGALEEITIAIDLAQKLSHAFSHVYAITFAAWLAQFMCNVSDCGRLADTAIANAKKQEFPLLLGMALVAKGWTISMLGDVATGLETVRQGISLYQSTGAELGMTAMLAVLAAITAQSGDLISGLKNAEQARELADRNNEYLFKAEIHRLIAEITLDSAEHLANIDQAQMRERAGHEARVSLEVARKQNAGTLILRAALTNLRAVSNSLDRINALREITDICKHFEADSSLNELQQARRIISQAIF